MNESRNDSYSEYSLPQRTDAVECFARWRVIQNELQQSESTLILLMYLDGFCSLEMGNQYEGHVLA